MRVLKILPFLLAFLAAPLASTRAGLDFTAPVPHSADLELVVMEAPGCIYCTIFRRDVLPAYQNSERGKDVPIRFLDVNDDAVAALGLEAPVNIVPTFVVLKRNKEMGRLPGYVGPEAFYHTINFLISTAP
jgi:thioredoxin-related protein